MVQPQCSCECHGIGPHWTCCGDCYVYHGLTLRQWKNSIEPTKGGSNGNEEENRKEVEQEI